MLLGAFTDFTRVRIAERHKPGHARLTRRIALPTNAFCLSVIASVASVFAIAVHHTKDDYGGTGYQP